jgi:hypothetical protein
MSTTMDADVPYRATVQVAAVAPRPGKVNPVLVGSAEYPSVQTAGMQARVSVEKSTAPVFVNDPVWSTKASDVEPIEDSEPATTAAASDQGGTLEPAKVGLLQANFSVSEQSVAMPKRKSGASLVLAADPVWSAPPETLTNPPAVVEIPGGADDSGGRVEEAKLSTFKQSAAAPKFKSAAAPVLVVDPLWSAPVGTQVGPPTEVAWGKIATPPRTGADGTVDLFAGSDAVAVTTGTTDVAGNRRGPAESPALGNWSIGGLRVVYSVPVGETVWHF